MQVLPNDVEAEFLGGPGMHRTAEQLHAVLHLPHAHPLHHHGVRCFGPGPQIQQDKPWYHLQVSLLHHCRCGAPDLSAYYTGHYASIATLMEDSHRQASEVQGWSSVAAALHCTAELAAHPSTHSNSYCQTIRWHPKTCIALRKRSCICKQHCTCGTPCIT